MRVWRVAATALALAALLAGHAGATLEPRYPPWPADGGDARATGPALIAILDSGVDLAHPEFTGLELVGWHDWINGRPDPYDDNGHGTAVAAHAVGGTLGTHPGGRLAVAKVIDASRAWDPHHVAGAIRHAVDAWGASVISLSANALLPVPDQAPPTGLLHRRPLDLRIVSDAIAYAESRHVLVVVAAGNGLSGVPLPSPLVPPASSPYAITVGSAARDGAPATASGHNLAPDVVQWGVDVRVPLAGTRTYAGGYAGTSFATPRVAGVAAQLVDAHGLQHDGRKPAVNWTRDVLLRAAVDRPDAPYAVEGYGFVDPAITLAASKQPLPVRTLDDAHHAASLWARHVY